MVKWYVEFKCWTEGKVDVPWPYVFFEETSDYRRRNDLSQVANPQLQESTFRSLNENNYQKFFDTYVNAVILGTVLDATDVNDIKKQIENVFHYCEILGSVIVDDSNISTITDVMSRAIKS